jgi:hypothetical protein
MGKSRNGPAAYKKRQTDDEAGIAGCYPIISKTK